MRSGSSGSGSGRGVVSDASRRRPAVSATGHAAASTASDNPVSKGLRRQMRTGRQGLDCKAVVLVVEVETDHREATHHRAKAAAFVSLIVGEIID
jgi:hypothetical protein